MGAATVVGALPGPLQDLVDNPAFRYGLKGGLIAAAVLALPGLLSGRLFRPAIPGGIVPFAFYLPTGGSTDAGVRACVSDLVDQGEVLRIRPRH